MALFPNRELSIAFDLSGCPNRCRHCRLGRADNGVMEVSEARLLFEAARRHVASGAEEPHLHQVRFFGSWFREPDYGDDYRQLHELELELNGGEDYSRDYELLSVWRLARDPGYARWAAERGVRKCQITFFGAEAATDWFCRRTGAFRDAIQATQRLLDHGIVPRWQLIQSKRILPDLSALLSLIDASRLRQKAEALGGEFVVFMHDPSPIGEAESIEDLRLEKDDLKLIPEDLMDSTARHMGLTDPYHTEAEWLQEIRSETDGPVGSDPPRFLWFAVRQNWEVYPSHTSLAPWWRLGSLRSDTPHDLVRRYLKDETTGQRELSAGSRRELARGRGDPHGLRIFMSKQDLLELYLERHLRDAASRENGALPRAQRCPAGA